ncbi:unnamed protein product, partial [Polarella glacialis]
ASAAADPAVPFRIEPEVGGRAGDSRATFFVPKGSADRLVERGTIAANGGRFDLLPGGTEALAEAGDRDVVQVVFYSPKPERTAEAIAKVIARRVADPDGPEMDECTIS